MRNRFTIALLGLSLMAAVPHASAFGLRGGGGPGFFGGGGGAGGAGGPAGMPLRILLHELNPSQRAQVRQILIANRGQMRDTLKALHDAHEALVSKMFAAGPLTDADVEPMVQKIAQLHQQLLENGAKVMLQVRAVASPDQLAKAATTKQKLDDLHAQMRDLFGDAADDAGAPDATE